MNRIRRSAAAIIAAGGLIAVLAVPAFAFSITAVNVECFTDQSGDVFVTGTVEWSGASNGDTVTLTLEGRIGNSGYVAIAGHTDTVTFPDTEYSIEVTDVVGTYDSFRVASSGSTSNERSRSFETDECSTVIPEAPITGLLALTGGLVALGFFLHRTRSRAAALPIA
jgi:hypothetical protein